jgi:hypothetical protein
MTDAGIRQYSFEFQMKPGRPLKFNLAGDQYTTFFGLLDIMLTSHPEKPKPTPLATVNDKGKNNAFVDVTADWVKTFSNYDTYGVNLYGYTFTLRKSGSKNKDWTYFLTSTDAESMFSVFDGILWSNPPSSPS